jgi:3-oxoadipate enol-lactonase
MKTRANGISMNYEMKGKGANLVLIHGAGNNLNMWYHQVPAFSKNYRVVTYDVRGSGKTDRPEGDYSMSLFVEDAYRLMQAIKVTDGYFLGFSMGGRIALELAVNYPEMVKALVLANSAVGGPSSSPQALERWRANIELLEKGEMKKVAEITTASAFSPNFRSKNPAEFEKYMKVKQQNKPDGIARLMRSMNLPANPLDLSKVKCPTLLIAGENDSHLGVEQANRTQEAIAGSKMVLLPTGHASAVELPKKFNSAVLEFLSGLK